MGVSLITANAFIADVSGTEDRARNFGLMGVAFGIGFIFGPALGGFLGEYHIRLPLWALWRFCFRALVQPLIIRFGELKSILFGITVPFFILGEK